MLVTLGIIGIVASMTIPNLLANYRKKVIENKLKKFYTTMSQAVLMSEIENGPSSDWSLNFASFDNSMNFYNTYLDKYLSKITVKKINEGRQDSIIYLSDGTAFKLSNGACADIEFYINKNKINKIISEQVAGKDYFSFIICPKNTEYNGGKPGGFQTASKGSLEQRMNRDYLLEHCKTPFPDGNTCSALIEFDGWKIKENYPYRF